MSSSRNDHRDRTTAASPSEHKEKSPVFIPPKKARSVLAGEDGLTESLCCRRRARKRQREGTG